MSTKETVVEPSAPKAFYQKASSPVVVLPEKLIHHDVTRVGEASPSGTKPPFFVVDLPTRSLSMTIGLLLPGEVTGKHRHSYESVMYITQGEGYTMIEEERVAWKAGDAIYIPVWTWHYNVNTSSQHPAGYVSCDNAPQMHQAGVALFEQASPTELHQTATPVNNETT